MSRTFSLGQPHAAIEALEQTVKTLREGGVAVFPTDTVYGIGLLVGAHPDGAEPLFRIKRRDHAKKIPLLIPSIEVLDEYGQDVGEDARALARAFWPGGLTLVVKAGPKVPRAYRNVDGTVALRVPGPSFALDLLGRLGEAMAVTSANTSGLPAPASADEVEGAIASQVDVVVRGALSCFGESSTIVRCVDRRCETVRQGAVCTEAIVSALKRKA